MKRKEWKREKKSRDESRGGGAGGPLPKPHSVRELPWFQGIAAAPPTGLVVKQRQEMSPPIFL